MILWGKERTNEWTYTTTKHITTLLLHNWVKIVKCPLPQKLFFAVFSENTSFFEKIVEYKNIQHQISDKKGYIHFWCNMKPDRLHSNTVGRVANKVRVERGFVPFNPYFYVPKYRSSDALPVPKIFLFFLFFSFFHLICGSTEMNSRHPDQEIGHSSDAFTRMKLVRLISFLVCVVRSNWVRWRGDAREERDVVLFRIFEKRTRRNLKSSPTLSSRVHLVKTGNPDTPPGTRSVLYYSQRTGTFQK